MDRRPPLSGKAKQIFDEYCKGLVKRIKSDVALNMFQTEFNLTKPHALVMFDMFDQDRNGYLSQWEFAQFYSLVGQNIDEIMTSFKSLEKDGSNYVDIEKTFDYMKTVKTNTGRELKDEELEQLMMQCAGNDRSIDLRKFIALWCRVKQMRDPEC